jgi:hypothetical protein
MGQITAPFVPCGVHPDPSAADLTACSSRAIRDTDWLQGQGGEFRADHGRADWASASAVFPPGTCSRPLLGVAHRGRDRSVASIAPDPDMRK